MLGNTNSQPPGLQATDVGLCSYPQPPYVVSHASVPRCDPRVGPAAVPHSVMKRRVDSRRAAAPAEGDQDRMDATAARHSAWKKGFRWRRRKRFQCNG